jgi:dipeptidyl aminopeptidase/acylaminoacyl peptidase
MSSPPRGGAWSQRGYFQFSPNFRGSAGFGQAFVRATFRDFGYGDLRDILSGVNKIVETLPVDRDRIGITGQSYGGYMTMMAVTQTQVFHAAVANAGISEWLSYGGNANTPRWANAFFGASVYENPAIYARTSPMTYVQNVKTPTLIIVGAGDGYCPPSQSLEYWYALESLGVKTKLVIYAEEGHSISKPENVRDVNQQTAEWFDKHLK